MRTVSIGILGTAFCLVTLPYTAAAGVRDPIFQEARQAIIDSLKDASLSFLGVRARTVIDAGSRIQVVCGFVSKPKQVGSYPWVYVPSTRTVHILRSNQDSGHQTTVKLLFAYCA